MNIWLINPYGPIPGEDWREYRFAVLARALTQRGHRVTWWTATFDHYSKRQRSAGWRTIRVTEAFTVILVPTPRYRRNVGPGRIAFELAYLVRLLRRAGTSTPAPDVIVAADPPQLAGGVAGARLARHFGVPLVLDCVDLWPEVFVGAFPEIIRPLASTLLTPLRWLRRATYGRAAAAVASCETNRRHLLSEVSGLSSDRTSTFFLGVARADYQKVAGDGVPGDARRPGEFRAIYAGTLGNNYDIDTLLDAAALLRDHEGFRLVIAGDGPMRDRLLRRIEEERLSNVTFIGRVATSVLAAWYRSCDAGVMPYAAWSTVVLPTKVFDYMAAGLPLVTSLSGEMRDLIEAHEMGVVYRAGDAASLADALRGLTVDEAGRARMAENAARAAIRFERDEQYGGFVAVIERVGTASAAPDGGR